MIIKPAERTLSVQEYYFSRKNKEMAALNAARTAKGLDPVVNLGVGAPDGRPPQAAIDALCSTAQQNGTHKYQPYVGTPELRKAFAGWYKKWYNVELDPATEIQPLFGSKEGILILSLAFLNKGDKVLVPDPGYPTYSAATNLVEAEMVPYDLCDDRGWQPDFDVLEKMDLSGVKMMWTNYPNMPTGAPATRELYARIVDFARRHGILVVNDNPYSFILTDEQLSILKVPGAKECCLELNSLSKAHNMSGWRIGMIAGDREYIQEFLKVKSQMDSGMFRGLQDAAVAALQSDESWFKELNDEYRRRRKYAAEIFSTVGAEFSEDSCGLFLFGKVKPGNAFARVPEARKDDVEYVAGFASRPLGEQVSEKILYDAGVFITPGYIFGHNGEQYIRISLCADVPTFERSLEKINSIR